MDKTYNLNEIAMMTGFTPRTLRNYLNQGLLKGEKINGAWQFTTEEIDRFFAEPFVKEGLRIKHSGIVFDFLADSSKHTKRSCVILDIPATQNESKASSAFFCKQMEAVSDAIFTFDWNNGRSRVIISGAEDAVAKIMEAYRSLQSDDSSRCI